MNQTLKEALGYSIVGVIMLLCLTDIVFPVIEFILQVCLFFIGGILILAGAGSFSEYINKRKIKEDNKKENL